jgi:hypothetical protein
MRNENHLHLYTLFKTWQLKKKQKKNPLDLCISCCILMDTALSEALEIFNNYLTICWLFFFVVVFLFIKFISKLQHFGWCFFYKFKCLHIWFSFIFTFSLNSSINPLNAGRSEHLTISDHDFSDNQAGAGFGKGFSKATPPVSKNRHSKSSIVPLKIVCLKI